jgi:hypothetical protein
MKQRILTTGLIAALAIVAGGTVLTTRADTRISSLTIHAVSRSPSTAGGVATCFGGTGSGNTGLAWATGATGLVAYEAGSGSNTLQVLGGASCAPGPNWASGSPFWAASNQWTSSRTAVTAHVCVGSLPFSKFAFCEVADDYKN